MMGFWTLATRTSTEFTWDNRDRLTEVKTYATDGGDPTQVVDYLYDVENRWIGENIFNGGTEHHNPLRLRRQRDRLAVRQGWQPARWTLPTSRTATPGSRTPWIS